MLESSRYRHRVTQLKAVKWLELKGFAVNIEYPLPFNGRIIRVDVYGIKDGYTVVIECGYSPEVRLNWIADMVDELYVISLGDETPTLWSNTMRICKACGRLYNEANNCDITELNKYYFWGGNNTDGNKEGDIVDWFSKSTQGDLKTEKIGKSGNQAKKRIAEICNMRNAGFTYEQIGIEFGISRERVRQLLPINQRGRIKGSRIILDLGTRKFHNIM